MRYSSRHSVEYDLEQHYILRAEYLNKVSELSEYEGFLIKLVTRRDSRSYYSLKKPGERRYTYSGDVTSPDIQNIKAYNFYKEYLKVIEKNICVMEDFLSVYQQTRAESINELLPKVYQLPRCDSLLKAEPEISRWLREKREIKKKAPVINPAGLTCRAFDGTMMRSRAECVHYEAFYIYDVPSIFEFPYEISSEIYSPDFTALDVFLMEPKIFEHLGNWFHKDMVKRNRYRAESVERWDAFSQIGFYPEVNLLLTFGSGESLFDAQAIHRKIAMLAVPPPSEETIGMLSRL